MKPTILLINFQDQQKLRKLKMALLPFKLRIKTIEPQDYSQPIRYLAERDFSSTDSISADTSGADGEGNADSCRNHGESV